MPACLERKVGGKKDPDPQVEPQKRYYVYVVEANLAFQNGRVIPLLSEVLTDLAADPPKDKQDWEQRAFGRLAQRLQAQRRATAADGDGALSDPVGVNPRAEATALCSLFALCCPEQRLELPGGGALRSPRQTGLPLSPYSRLWQVLRW